MSQNNRLTAAPTHFANQEKVKVDQGEFGVENHQREMLLTEPPEMVDEVNTHRAGDIKFKGPKKPVVAAVVAKKRPVRSALHDLEEPTGGKIAEIDNEEDPSIGYLEKEAGMPVIQNASAEDFAHDEGEEDEFSEIESSEEGEEFTAFEPGEESADAEFDEDEGAEGEEYDPTLASDDEFQDLADFHSGEPEAPAEAKADAQDGDAEPEELPFDKELPPTEAATLADVDGLDDNDSDNCAFAVCSSVIHVIHGNRIIASMTPHAARKAGVSDIYLSDQYQDVVAHTLDTKGIRKGLVQSGFLMAKVKVAQNKVQAKAIEAKVNAALNKRVEASVAQDKAMEQALAIAAVGINRRFFKDTPNELKAGLETELQRLGVRGASKVVSAMFSKHGVDYARSIVTLAKKLAAMPEDHRNQFADALDLTEDENFEAPEGVEETADFEGVETEDDFEPVPASLTAALLRPAQRSATKLTASKSAMSFLTGNQSLV